MIPKSEKALDRAFEMCSKKKVFIQINKDSYRDYWEEALSDLASAQKEFKDGSLKWAVVKAYQALFSQCTAVLVKNLGVYSKDHGCLVIALLKNRLISKEVFEKVEGLFSTRETLYSEIERIRIFRNKALYFPKTQSQIGGNEEVERLLEEVRQLISAIGEQL